MQRGNMISRLIIINIAVFLFTVLIKLVFIIRYNDPKIVEYQYYNNFLKLLSVPYDLSILPSRFWTLFTYMFLHVGIIHIL